ncbi:3-hydroxyacyl-CoA dehydrogenase NAD-binding domain-containing protein [Loktanella sp. M215]|uniref:3-hydroxyacyl-CoA dehydrogenase NAD-binding domain-containing protein n=1 Tax=Loktanella sp. M215 TaxID=2675431 RepID=UPI001F25B353|nr:3-hydroxyacyl-CoA dehydrogenase NAD-binding domain-containing protein [Loktanella sp. M215]MCF7697869.1 3-hydroxyacyl-CoA dehydrogenase [Loktanella sp. M215]
MAKVVTLEKVGRTGLIAFDNPPVNAASHALRQAFQDCLERAAADPDIDVIALYGKGRSFVAGADIREFGRTPQAPILPTIINRMEEIATPVIAIQHGVALGGGLEIALGAQARVGVGRVRVGLPEVTLGILPGAGGTQRAPRLTGVPAAIEMITTGRHIQGPEALAMGLLDRLTDGEPRDVALAMAEEVRAGTLPVRTVGQIAVNVDPQQIAAAKAAVQAQAPHLYSPLKCVEAIAACDRPILDGMDIERALFRDCLDSPQRAGLIHVFFAERAVAKIPERDATPRSVASVGIIGGGTMGSGIATACLMAGLRVRLNERDADALARGRQTILSNLDGAVKRGKMKADGRTDAEHRLSASTVLGDFDDVDLVIEAAFEDMGVKIDLFTQLDAICKPGAVLATNTSYLDIDRIAAATARPQDVIGLHFFSPAHIMKLLEVVVADKTAPEVVATGFALAAKLKKVAVRAGVCDGFIGNRILTHYRKAADYLVLDGASPEQIDDALEGFGWAMGPFRANDLSGLDIGYATRKRRAPDRPAAERYSAVPDRIAEAGWLGRKTGMGYYDHSQKPAPTNPGVATIIATVRNDHGITPRAIPDAEIVDRYMTAMIVEATRVVEDGIAQRPIDIDATFLFGYGFPRWRGGPMHYADTIGAATLVQRIETYARDDPHYWQVPPLLQRMADDGTTFADLNAEA